MRHLIGTDKPQQGSWNGWVTDSQARPLHKRHQADGSLCSEGGDDFHCTQIMIEDDDESDSHENTADVQEYCFNEFETAAKPSSLEDSRPARKVSPSPLSFVVQPTATTAASASDKTTNADACFICGTSLSNLKRRLDHIKRCSKKHGITARDVKTTNDTEAFATSSNPSRSINQISNSNKNNPYSNDSFSS